MVLEPDSLGDFNCMSQAQINDRVGMLARAANQFRSRAPNTWAYLDAGNIPVRSAPRRCAPPLVAWQAWSDAHGFALNVSNCFPTGGLLSSGDRGRRRPTANSGHNRPYVIDTSRNGNGCRRSTGATSQTARIGTPEPARAAARRCCCG